MDARRWLALSAAVFMLAAFLGIVAFAAFNRVDVAMSLFGVVFLIAIAVGLMQRQSRKPPGQPRKPQP